ncbi:MAG: CvpA family protein [Proteobacteria bacterium]|nr:CvpA family protein [Pseudomonadota bacterium]
MQTENWIDLIIFIIVFISLVAGAWRGLFVSVFSILALILAVIVTYTKSDLLLTTALALFGDTPFTSVAATGTTFIVAFLFFGILGRLIANSLKKIDFIGVNLGGGGLFGFLRGILLCSLLILLLSATGIDRSTAWATSQTVPLLGSVMKSFVQLPFMANYRGWVQFDSQQRPRLVLERPNLPTALPQEEKKKKKKNRKEKENNDEDTAHPLPQVNQLKKRKKDYNEIIETLASVVAVPSPASKANKSRVKDQEPESLEEILRELRQVFYATSDYSETDPDKPCTDNEPCSEDTKK